MSKRTNFVVASVVAILVGGASIPLWAQGEAGSPAAEPQSSAAAPEGAGPGAGPATPPGPPSGMPPGGGMPMMMMTMMCHNPDAKLAGELAYQEVRLGITDAQRPAWRKMADAIKAAQEPVRHFCSQVASQPAPTTFPERLQRMQEMAEAHATAMRNAIPAITQMYNQLTPDQKKLADEIMVPGRGSGMRGCGMMLMHRN